MVRSALARFTAGATVGLLVVLGLVVAQPISPAKALSGSDFDPGNIISDADFYQNNAMSDAEIQAFLVSARSGLQSLRFSVASRAESVSDTTGNVRCLAFTGGVGLPASTIIYRAQAACGISAKVILVTLQKEQGLITYSSPSQAALDRAMGMACPDTAPCAADKLGFGNQVYEGAKQLNTYRASLFGMQPGVHAIRWSPNAACGAWNVNVQNYATAALYNYTPYQPNAAALANLNGTGDSCSSYGNRNFWAYYESWFGFTPPAGSLVRTDSNPAVYLATDTYKYPVSTAALYSSLNVLGPAFIVKQSYLDSRALGPEAGTLLRDETTGEIYLASYGVRHKFLTCALVAQYFGACANFINLPSDRLNLFKTGADMTAFLSSGTPPATYFISNAAKHRIHDLSSMAALAAGGSTSAISVPTFVTDSLRSGADLLSTGLFISIGSNTQTYLTTGPTTAVEVSAAAADAFGFGNPINTAGETLASITISQSPLTLAVVCQGNTYVAGGGRLWKVPNSFGLPTTTLDATTCAALTKSSDTVTAALFLRDPSNGYIYNIANGKKTFMSTWDQVIAANSGSQTVVLVPSSTATLNLIPTEVGVLPVASMVKNASSPTVYFVDGAQRKIPVPTFTLTTEFGVNGYSVKADATLAPYTTTTSPLTLAVVCQGNTYVAGGGRLWKVPKSFGLPTTTLDATTCAALTKSSDTVTAALFLRDPSNGYIYNIANGKKTFMSTWDQVIAANSGSQTVVLVPSSTATLNLIPTA